MCEIIYVKNVPTLISPVEMLKEILNKLQLFIMASLVLKLLIIQNHSL